jgi:hypothetical protein
MQYSILYHSFSYADTYCDDLREEIEWVTCPNYGVARLTRFAQVYDRKATGGWTRRTWL